METLACWLVFPRHSLFSQILVKVKNSSYNCWPTVGQLLANCWSTDGRQFLFHFRPKCWLTAESANSYNFYTVLFLYTVFNWQSFDSCFWSIFDQLNTVSRLSVMCQWPVGWRLPGRLPTADKGIHCSLSPKFLLVFLKLDTNTVHVFYFYFSSTTRIPSVDKIRTTTTEQKYPKN